MTHPVFQVAAFFSLGVVVVSTVVFILSTFPELQNEPDDDDDQDERNNNGKYDLLKMTLHIPLHIWEML
jgi:hypothetical protein